jgi:probable FeS assembly SUF system protein SufT
MYSLNYVEVEVLSDITAILIPDGTETAVKAGQKVHIQQVLGGMFTVQTESGYLLRIDGKDAAALGQPLPDERRSITLETVQTKTLHACVMDQLRTCYDPEIPVNIVDLGLIYECEVNENNESGAVVRVEMTLTAPGCGMGEILKSDVEKKIKDIPTVSEVLIDLVFEPPWESGLMSEAAKLQLGFL